jgi:hypothetical protein
VKKAMEYTTRKIRRPGGQAPLGERRFQGAKL